MRPLFIVSAARYSGAGAVAEHCCRALREVSVDAELLFNSGDNLEERLKSERWAHAALSKERSPVDFIRALRTIRHFAANASVVITHLQHDHTMTVLSRVGKVTPLIRSFRNPSHFRSDAWHRWLARPISGALLAHSRMKGSLKTLHGHFPHEALPVPLEDRFNTDSDGSLWREKLGIPAKAPVLG
ncbi:MAG: glycosyltransferase family 4 protein, partial [bacterium]|nr:glycosyltransferase family 4 protein [bacterium]